MASILSLSEFNIIVQYAKAVAAKSGRASLDCEGFLAGAWQALERLELAQLRDALQSRKTDIEPVATRLGTVAVDAADMRTKTPMKLADELRSAIRQNYTGDVETLIALIDTCLESSRKRNASCGGIAGLPGDPDQDRLLQLANVIACRLGSSEIDLAIIAAACWRGAALELFDSRPGLKSHIASHAECFDTLIRARGWSEVSRIGSLPEATDGVMLPIAKSVREKAEDAEDKLYRLVTAATEVALIAETRERAAYHEAGHAVAFVMLLPEVRITKISVEPTEEAAGSISIDQIYRKHHRSGTRDGRYQHAVCLLAGRAAEAEVFGCSGINDGANADIETATHMLWEAIANHGLSPEFGPLSLRVVANSRWGAGGGLFARAEALLEQALRSAEKDSTELVKRAKPAIEAVGRQISKHGTMVEDALLRVLAQHRLPEIDCRFPTPVNDRRRNGTFGRIRHKHRGIRTCSDPRLWRAMARQSG